MFSIIIARDDNEMEPNRILCSALTFNCLEYEIINADAHEGYYDLLYPFRDETFGGRLRRTKDQHPHNYLFVTRTKQDGSSFFAAAFVNGGVELYIDGGGHVCDLHALAHSAELASQGMYWRFDSREDTRPLKNRPLHTPTDFR